MIFNTHTHLNDKRFIKMTDQIIADCKKNGITKLLVVGYDIETSKRAIELAEKYSIVYASVGIHPVDSNAFNQDTVNQLEKMLQSKKVVAIGECGLDYHWDTCPKEKQMYSFKEQIKLANKYNLPVIVHCRDAINDTYNILKDSNSTGVMHCYSGSLEMASKFIELNYYISLAGPVTFKNAKVPKEIAENIDLSKLLVETDDPYLTPVPFRGKENKANYVKYIIDEIAKLRGLNSQLIGQNTYDNAMRLFKIGESKNE